MGGKEAAPLLVPFLRDRSWMIRSAALRALTVLKHPKTSDAVIPLLRDRALVVRSQAVDAVRTLRPNGATEALVSALEHGANYQQGKARWIPQKALDALVELKPANAQEVCGRLKPLLQHRKDPALLERTVATLEALSGKRLKPGASLDEQVRAWQATL